MKRTEAKARELDWMIARIIDSEHDRAFPCDNDIFETPIPKLPIATAPILRYADRNIGKYRCARVIGFARQRYADCLEFDYSKPIKKRFNTEPRSLSQAQKELNYAKECLQKLADLRFIEHQRARLNADLKFIEKHKPKKQPVFQYVPQYFQTPIPSSVVFTQTCDCGWQYSSVNCNEVLEKWNEHKEFSIIHALRMYGKPLR